MKKPNVPILAVTLFSVVLLLVFVSGRYNSLISGLSPTVEEEITPTEERSKQSTRNSTEGSSTVSEAAVRLKCVVYERPPRTGSTTIGIALEKCLVPHGYNQPIWKGFEGRSAVITDMLQQNHERVMAVSRHFYMNETVLLQLRSRCKSLLYITSTAPMKQRLWSLVKYRQFQKHGNTSLNKEQVKSAIADLERETIQIKILNAYPYLHNGSASAVDIAESERIVPDYVIRKSMLVEDVSALLRAFGCSAQVISQNIHRAKTNEILDKVEIKDDDSLHTRLLHYAGQRNKEGLKRALDFGR